MTLEFVKSKPHNFWEGRKVILTSPIQNTDQSRFIPSGIEIPIIKYVGANYYGFELKYKKHIMSTSNLNNLTLVEK